MRLFTILINPRRVLLSMVLVFFTVQCLKSQPDTKKDEYVGSEKCASCHDEIASVQLESDHALSVRKVGEIPEFVKALPLCYVDQTNGVEYRIEGSTSGKGEFDLVASKGQQTEKLRLIWAFGAGRKGLTFVGRSRGGQYGQSRLSYFHSSNSLDITPGSKGKVKNAEDALADWFDTAKREECFNCHVSKHADLLPEAMDRKNAGVHCERCHGPGQRHIESVTHGIADLAIRNPGKLNADEQYQFCGTCHRAPPGNFESEAIRNIMADRISIRYPARRLILSRCYSEGDGDLKCTTCHNPHERLATSAEYYDRKCQLCHNLQRAEGTKCPVASKDCVSCHMPRGETSKHLSFADHWIRKVPSKAPSN